MRAKSRGVLYRTLRATLVLAIVPTIALYLLHSISWGSSSREPIDFADDGVGSGPDHGTLWEVLRGDDRISKFADVVDMFDDIVLGLSTPQAKFTVYAPVNEAFANEYFPPDLPWFYWKFLAGYQMGPGVVTPADFSSHGTVSSFVNADIFHTYRQRISVQSAQGQVTLNHKSSLLVRPLSRTCIEKRGFLSDNHPTLGRLAASHQRVCPSH